MRIAVDLSRAVNEQAGIARYTRSVVREMIKLSPSDHWDCYATYMRGAEGKQAVAREITSELVRQFRVPGQLKEWLWTTPLSLPDQWYPGSDVLFAPSFFELPLGTHKKSVVVIHDMTAALFPEQRGRLLSARLMWYLTRAVQKASAVICISENTRADLLRLVRLDPSKVFVTPLAVDPTFQPLKKTASTHEPKTILMVGTIEPRKNVDRVLKAYAGLPAALRAEYHLVVVGALGWNFSQVFTTLDQANLERQVTFVGHVSDDELVRRYQQAAVFVYPSLYEGFGLPPLEAMSCGVPVITSNVSSLPEVVGGAALLVDPLRVEAIRDALTTVLTKPALAAKLRAAGLVQARKFSWQQTAKQTLDIIHGV